MGSPTFTVEQITSTTGARILGLDPRDVDATAAERLRGELSTHGVLVFRCEGMTAEEQVGFAAQFGPTKGHPVREFLSGTASDPVAIVENASDKPSQDDQDFHTDYSFNSEVPDLAILRPEVLPSRGGDTIWSSTRAAYAGLSDRYKNLLAGLAAVHDAGERFWFEMHRTLGPEPTNRLKEVFSGVSHPVVTAHPHNNEPLLYVNQGYTTRIVDLTARESRSLLTMLFDQLNDPSYHYRHRWHMGDLVMWDEHATVHMGPHDFYPEHRRLTRVTAGHSRPVALAACS